MHRDLVYDLHWLRHTMGLPFAKETTPMNTDKAEILGKPVAAAENTGVTSGVREDLQQHADQTIAPDAQVQNTGDDDLTADDQGDDSANGDEEGPTDPFEA